MLTFNNMSFNIIAILLNAILLVSCESPLYRWRTIGFGDLNKNESDIIGGHKFNNPLHVVPTGISIYRERVFMTVARRLHGIPSTLNYFDSRAVRDNEAPLFRSYPDAVMNELRQDSNNKLIPDPSKIISVYRTRVDDCNRLWFIDTGFLESEEKPIQPPSLWIIDLRTDKLIRRFEIPELMATRPEGFTSLAVDTAFRCDRSFAYIPNSFTNNILVYSLEKNHAWVFTHLNSADTSDTTRIVVVRNITLNPNYSNSISLGRRSGRDRYRTAYFQPHGSLDSFSISTEVLRSELRALNKDYFHEFKNLGNRGSNSQAVISDIDLRTNVLYFAEVQKSGITCWDTKKSLSPNNVAVVAQDFETLTYTSDIKVDGRGYVWFLSSRQTTIDDNNFDNSTYNFFVHKNYGRQMVQNSICDSGTTRKLISDYDEYGGYIY